MAHADYECCAICDDKVYYNPDAEAKNVLCPSCAFTLGKKGILENPSVSKLIEWIKTADRDFVIKTLANLGFRACYYANDVDDAVASLGVKFDKNRYIVID